MNKRLIVLAASLAISTNALRAEDAAVPAQPAEPAQPAVEVSVAAEPPAEGAGVIGDKGKETLSVDFPNAEIRTILRNVADLYDLNLVIPETLEGRTSLKLRDVTWKQIFDVLLPPVGYTYVSDGNIIKVVSIESLNVEPVDTRIIVLNYSRAAEIAPTITSMIDTTKGGKIQVDVRSNALVVTERPKRLEKIDEVIKRLDKATPQVMIETKFIEVTDRDLKDLGVNWSSLKDYKIGMSPTPLLVRGGQASIRNADQLLLEDAAKASTAFGAIFNESEFATLISALQSNSLTKLISNPTVVTMNNNEAVISIGEQYPVPSYTYNQERGTFEVSGFTYKDIGIILKVTPQVNNAGLITLKIDPEVSSRSGVTTFGGAGGAEIPIISTRRTSTQIAIQDGYTMGLGGLIENTVTNSETKVPLLGDIPLIGGAFRSKSKDDSKRNLIVFITAKVMSPEGSTYHDVFSPDKMEKMGVSESDVPLASANAK